MIEAHRDDTGDEERNTKEGERRLAQTAPLNHCRRRVVPPREADVESDGSRLSRRTVPPRRKLDGDVESWRLAQGPESAAKSHSSECDALSVLGRRPCLSRRGMAVGGPFGAHHDMRAQRVAAGISQLRASRTLLAGVAACALGAVFVSWHVSSRPRPVQVPSDDGASTKWVDISLPDDFYTQSVESMYHDHVQRVFGFWTCPDAFNSSYPLTTAPVDHRGQRCHKPITAGHLAALEWLAKGGAYRIRYTGDKILYRPLIAFEQTYRVQRLEWIMKLFEEMAADGLLTTQHAGGRAGAFATSSFALICSIACCAEAVRFDAVFRMADSPQITKDTLSKDAGYLLFGRTSSPLHLDVPVPDQPQYGSNGNYVWPDRSELVPWQDKQNRAVFRGTASFSFGVDNWHMNGRVRLTQFAQTYPDLFDAGVTGWRPKALKPVTGDNQNESLFRVPTTQYLEETTGVPTVKSMSFREQSAFKYIIDIDGGITSSRRINLLRSGSVPLFVNSPYTYAYGDILKPWVHYVPISEQMWDLPSKVEWLREHEQHARFIADNAIRLAERFLSREAIKVEMSLMMKAYASLQASDVDLDDSDVSVDFCATAATR